MLQAKRLTRRGLASAAGPLAAAASPRMKAWVQAMPSSLVSSTSAAAIELSIGRATSGLAAANAASLAEGVVKAMFLSKLKLVAAVVLAFAVLSGGGLRLRAARRPG